MSNFEDHLWAEFVREHGNALAQMRTPTAKHLWRGSRLVAGTSLGLAGVGAAVALLLGATTPAPAFAVTRNDDGTVTVKILRAAGIAGANAKLHQLGIRAQVVPQIPVGCGQGPMAGKGAPAPPGAFIDAHWTINPRKIPASRTLALTPPPDPGQNSGNSGTGGTGGKVSTCAFQGRGEPAPGARNSGNNGNSGTAVG